MTLRNGLTPTPATEIDLAPLIHEINAIGLEFATEKHEVILYNDDHHVFEDVIAVVQLATGYPPRRAEAIVQEVHIKGKGIAYTGALEDCHRVAAIFAQVRLLFTIQ